MDAVKRLPPGSFALVMATGIISIAAAGLGLDGVANGLLLLNRAAFAVLVALTLARLLLHGRDVRADLGDSARAPGFLTWVAALCVLGGQQLVIARDWTGAAVLWAVAVALWLVLFYALALAVITGDVASGPGQGPNGGWMLAVVATQAVSALGSLLAAGFGPWQDTVLLFAAALFLFGCLLYILLSVIIVSHFIRHTPDPAAFNPAFWIMMGASAITTLSGSHLLLAGAGWTELLHIKPFVEGLTLLFWAAATWWIPLLVLLGLWRHVWRRIPLQYDPQFWAMVFPLGMYTACTVQLTRATGLPLPAVLPRTMLAIALGAWLVTLLGLAARLSRNWPHFSPKHTGRWKGQ